MGKSKSCLEEEMLERDLSVGIKVCVGVSEVAENHELCCHQDDFDELEKKLPGCLPPGQELLDGVHEEKGQLSA